MNISRKDLEGALKLTWFTSLNRLDCSDNRLTKLDLSNCVDLEEIDCSNNELDNLSFLKYVRKLKKFCLHNNQNLSFQDLGNLVFQKELRVLNINNCSFEGSLKPLNRLTKLEEIHITNTNINEGLEYLPKSCKKLYCNSDYQYRSTRIMEGLEKSNCSEDDEKVKYYNLDKWRIDKQNNMIASVIPLERLYVIRGNIKGFIKKWGVKKDLNNDEINIYWYNRFSNLLSLKQDGNNLSELSKLQHPSELGKLRLAIYTIQFIGRGAAVAGVVLTFQDQGTIGGGILGVYPFTELAVSKLEERLKEKENKWKEFLDNADNFLDNYNELLGILAPIKVENMKTEGISKTLKNLNEKVETFLDTYDNDENREIDIEELVKERKMFANDLDKMWEIIEIIKELENSINEYRKSSYNWITEKELQEENNQKINLENFERIIEGNNWIENDSSSPILDNREFEEGEITPSASSFHFTNLTKRKKSIVKEDEVYELQNRKSESQNVATSSSSEYNFVIQIPPK